MKVISDASIRPKFYLREDLNDAIGIHLRAAFAYRSYRTDEACNRSNGSDPVYVLPLAPLTLKQLSRSMRTRA